MNDKLQQAYGRFNAGDLAGTERLCSEILAGAPRNPDALHLLGVVRLPLQDVSLTTNGQLIERKLPVLRESGIRRINVSLDTLNPASFRRIARGGDLATVLRGIEGLLAAP